MMNKVHIQRGPTCKKTEAANMAHMLQDII